MPPSLQAFESRKPCQVAWTIFSTWDGESDLDALAVPGSVKVAGGIFVPDRRLHGADRSSDLGVLTVVGPIKLVAPVALALGVGAMVLGAGVALARRLVSASIGLGLAPAIGLFALVWAVFALLNGVL